MNFEAPAIAYGALSPLIVVLGAGVLGVLVEAALPRRWRYLVQTLLTLAAFVGALVATVLVASGMTVHGEGAARGELVLGGTVAVDGPAVFLWGLLLLIGIGGMLLFAERRLGGGLTAFSGQAAALPGSDAESKAWRSGYEHTEVYPLMLFATGGMMLFTAANDLLVMFVALEVLSLPLYLLAGLARRRRLLSQEAALKYFLLGAFSSGFFIYGAALVYGFAGSMELGAIHVAVRNEAGNPGLLLAGIALLAVGVLFKVGAVPFHAWTPDVYQGAPTAVTAFMAAGTKVAAFGAMLRLFYVAFGASQWSWEPMLWVIAILTMVVGAVLAISQTDVKRMLAYSAIAHTGFLLTGVLGLQAGSAVPGAQITSLQAVLFYLVVYAIPTIGAFAVVTVVRDDHGEINNLRRWAGLGREAPVLAGTFAFFLLSMAGIPLTAGFVGKWAVFAAALAAGAWPVVLVAVGASVVAAVFYIRVIVLMYFASPSSAEGGPAVVTPSLLTGATIAFGFAATVLLGILPGPVIELAGHAGEFLR